MGKDEIKIAKLPDLSQMTDEEIDALASKISAIILKRHKEHQKPKD